MLKFCLNLSLFICLLLLHTVFTINIEGLSSDGQCNGSFLYDNISVTNLCITSEVALWLLLVHVYQVICEDKVVILWLQAISNYMRLGFFNALSLLRIVQRRLVSTWSNWILVYQRHNTSEIIKEPCSDWATFALYGDDQKNNQPKQVNKQQQETKNPNKPTNQTETSKQTTTNKTPTKQKQANNNNNQKNP